MKVAYVNYIPSKDGILGVEKKLVAQTRAISRLGLDMDVFYCGLHRQLHDDSVYFCQFRGGFLFQQLLKLSSYAYALKSIDPDRYDFLVLRYYGGNFSLWSTYFREQTAKIISEHHGKEFAEIASVDMPFPKKMLALMMDKFLDPKYSKGCRGSLE